MTINTENKIKALTVLAGGVSVAFAFIFGGRLPEREISSIENRRNDINRIEGRREDIRRREGRIRERERRARPDPVINRREMIRRTRRARQVCRFRRCT